VRIGIDISRRTDVRRKRGVDKSGIGIGIIEIVHFLYIAGNRVLNYQLFKIVLSAMVIDSMIYQMRDSKPIISVLMGQSGEEHQYMIGWGQA